MRCCHADCTTHSCRNRTHHIDAANETLCTSRACGVADDDLCCEGNQPCSEWACPIGQHHVDGSQSVLCVTSACTDADTPLCCEGNNRCTSHSCPERMHPNTTAANEACAAAQCNAVDDLLCCAFNGEKQYSDDGNLPRLSPELCSGLSCPPLTHHIPDASTTHCSTAVCTNADDSLCCQPNGLVIS